MNIKKVNMIRDKYRERAINTENPNGKDREIWNTSVLASSCYILFVTKPIRNIKYAIRYIETKRRLEILMKGENF